MLLSLVVLSLQCTSRPDHSCSIDPSFYIDILPGDAALLITVPHDGIQALCTPARQPGAMHFSMDRDAGTTSLALEIRNRYALLHRSKPTILINRLHRRFVDVNRPAADAAQHPSGHAFYVAYHRAIQTELQRLKKSHATTMLVDLHSQSSYPADIMTSPGAAEALKLSTLLHRYSVYGLSQTARAGAMEHTCLLPCELPLREVPHHYLDGYTSETYRREGTETVQIEIHGRLLRSEEQIRRLAIDLAGHL